MNRQPARDITVASFFTGAGGLDLGFERLGFDIRFATDIDPVYCKTLDINKPKYVSRSTKVINSDIRKLTKADVPTAVDLVIGGPPCQTFSASGRRAGGAPGTLDSRGNLFLSYCEWIDRLHPKAFVFENVRGILGTNRGKDWEDIVQAFSAIGYSLAYRVLDASDYGVPQYRERVFLIGHQTQNDILFPRPSHGSNSLDGRNHVSPREAFAPLVRQREDLEQLMVDSGKYAELLPAVPPGDNYLFFTERRGHHSPVFAYRSRFSDFLYKAHPDYPVKTIIARPGKYTGPFHWDNRRFSVAEYKAIQGFPQDYEFSGSRNQIVAQIGNSVSPNIARAIAQAVGEQIFAFDTHIPLLPVDEQLAFDKRKGNKARQTRQYHSRIEASKRLPTHSPSRQNHHKPYSARVEPTSALDKASSNVEVSIEGTHTIMEVYNSSSEDLFVEMSIDLTPPGARSSTRAPKTRTLQVRGFGNDPGTVQTMWNAVDDWVIRTSDYHSLFELYGHFTEPHPQFSITAFSSVSNSPFALFAEFASQFDNCSRYIPKEDLESLFVSLESPTYESLAKILRAYRWDLRSKETNIALPSDVFMIAYPFTLPYRRQMNFSVKESNATDKSESYVNFVRSSGVQ